MTTKTTDKRDSGRLGIAMLLGIWLVFWFICLTGSIAGMFRAETLGWWCLSAFGCLGNVVMLLAGVEMAVKFVTGRDVTDR